MSCLSCPLLKPCSKVKSRFSLGFGMLACCCCCLKYVWAKAWFTVRRIKGLNTTRDSSKNRASSVRVRLALGKSVAKDTFFLLAWDSRNRLACELFTWATSVGLGAPITSKIKVNWWKKSFPGKRGLRSSSSAKMHPTDHMSTA